MAIVDAIAYAAHLLAAGVWSGSVIFVTWAILPVAARGDTGPALLEHVTDRLALASRACSLVLLLSGGHMAAQRYTFESLAGSPRGHAVLGMVVLWFVLTGLVEAAVVRLRDGTAAEKVRTPARKARPFLLAASAVALLLLLDAGLLAGNVV